MEEGRGIEPQNSGFADRTQQTQLGIPSIFKMVRIGGIEPPTHSP